MGLGKSYTTLWLPSPLKSFIQIGTFIIHKKRRIWTLHKWFSLKKWHFDSKPLFATRGISEHSEFTLKTWKQIYHASCILLYQYMYMFDNDKMCANHTVSFPMQHQGMIDILAKLLACWVRRSVVWTWLLPPWFQKLGISCFQVTIWLIYCWSNENSRNKSTQPMQH